MLKEKLREDQKPATFIRVLGVLWSVVHQNINLRIKSNTAFYALYDRSFSSGSGGSQFHFLKIPAPGDTLGDGKIS